METVNILAAVALIALASAVGSLIQLHRLAPEVAPSRDAVSNYGAGPHASLYRAQVVLVGLAAAAISMGVRSAGLASDGLVWLGLTAVGLLLV